MKRTRLTVDQLVTDVYNCSEEATPAGVWSRIKTGGASQDRLVGTILGLIDATGGITLSNARTTDAIRTIPLPLRGMEVTQHE